MQSGTAQAGSDSTCCARSAAVETVLGCYLAIRVTWQLQNWWARETAASVSAAVWSALAASAAATVVVASTDTSDVGCCSPAWSLSTTAEEAQKELVASDATCGSSPFHAVPVVHAAPNLKVSAVHGITQLMSASAVALWVGWLNSGRFALTCCAR